MSPATASPTAPLSAKARPKSTAPEVAATLSTGTGDQETPALVRYRPHRPALTCDAIIVGCGVSGCYAALNLPSDMRIVMLSKGDLESCDSMLAQGGICVLHDPDDYDAFFHDTMRAGHYENRKESVDIMIRSSRAVIADLVRRGVRFARTEDGSLDYTREGAHSRNRICYHEDITGREITTVLQRDVQQLSNVRIMEHTTMDDILEKDGACIGVLCHDSRGSEFEIKAPDTILATGGVGGLYLHSTNFPLLTGDGCRICDAHDVELEHMDYVQIHPTSLYTGKPGRSFLISESARGEGAVLLDARGERFVDELQPRDVVANAINEQMERDHTDHVYLSFASMEPDEIRRRFPNIYETCLAEGYDITKEPLPVVPAQHYLMGGIHVDRDSATTMPHLYAVGETSCNGVHGANRLASNSLLESLVFAQRAAHKIAYGLTDANDGTFPAHGEAQPAADDTTAPAASPSSTAPASADAAVSAPSPKEA